MTKKFPGCVLFLLDRSGSMDDPFGGAPMWKKSQKSAEAVNRATRDLALRSQRGDSIQPKCDVGMIGYGGSGVGSAFDGALRGWTLASIADIADEPLRQPPESAAAVFEPEWVEPRAEGGTPMDEAFRLAHQWIERWVRSHPDSFPPIVINVTDGEPNDPAATVGAAEALKRIETSDGSTLLMNVHISSDGGAKIVLPSHESELPPSSDGDASSNAYAALLFQISSTLPDCLVRSAEEHGFTPAPGARGYVYNADAETLIRVLLFGSDPKGLR